MAKKKAAKTQAKASKPAEKKEVKPRQKKESNKFLIWAVVVVIIVVLLFLLKGVKKAPEAPVTPEVPPEAAPTQPTEEAPPTEAPEEGVPPTERGESLVTKEDLATGEYTQASLIGMPQNKDETLAKDLTAEPERFSNFKCFVDEETGVKYASIKVTNTNSDQAFLISHAGIKKGYNTYFMIKNMVDMNPKCGTEELAPGESTVCEMIGQDNPIYTLTTGTNRITIQSPLDDGKKQTEAVVIDCP